MLPIINVLKKGNTMNINIQGNGFTVTQAMRESIALSASKLDKLSNFIGNSTLNITLRKEGDEFVCGTTLRVNKKDHHMEVHCDSMYRGVNVLLGNLVVAITKAKEKSTNTNNFIVDRDDEYADDIVDSLLEEEFDSHFDD